MVIAPSVSYSLLLSLKMECSWPLAFEISPLSMYFSSKLPFFFFFLFSDVCSKATSFVIFFILLSFQTEKKVVISPSKSASLCTQAEVISHYMHRVKSLFTNANSKPFLSCWIIHKPILPNSHHEPQRNRGDFPEPSSNVCVQKEKANAFLSFKF